MTKTKKKSKRLEWHEDVIHAINIKAVKKKTDFKNYVQQLVEKHAGK